MLIRVIEPWPAAADDPTFKVCAAAGAQLNFSSASSGCVRRQHWPPRRAAPRLALAQAAGRAALRESRRPAPARRCPAGTTAAGTRASTAAASGSEPPGHFVNYAGERREERRRSAWSRRPSTRARRRGPPMSWLAGFCGGRSTASPSSSSSTPTTSRSRRSRDSGRDEADDRRRGHAPLYSDAAVVARSHSELAPPSSFLTQPSLRALTARPNPPAGRRRHSSPASPTRARHAT